MTTALIDGDIIAYNSAAGAETAINLGGDTDDDCMWHVEANETKARAAADAAIAEIKRHLGASKVAVVLSDSVHNWRLNILPSYKSNRANSRRPVILPHIRQYLRDEHRALERPALEGDDLMGILATVPGATWAARLPHPRIIVSRDKDMRTIPGFFCRMGVDGSLSEVEKVTTSVADRNHLLQGLAGDVVDGYSGCPGIGMGTAAEFLSKPYLLRRTERTIAKGKRAGETQVRWVKEYDPSPGGPALWECIYSLFARHDISTDEAIKQFQVARICRASDYDFQNKKVIAWTPDIPTTWSPPCPHRTLTSG